MMTDHTEPTPAVPGGGAADRDWYAWLIDPLPTTVIRPLPPDPTAPEATDALHGALS